MPRLTRAQLKAQAEEIAQIHEDNDCSSETREASPDCDSARPALKDITTINLIVDNQERPLEAMPQKKSKAKKGGRKNAKKQEDSLVEVMPEVEVLEDHDQSDNSDAAEVAAESLQDEKSSTEPIQVIMDDTRPHTPMNPAVEAAVRSLSKSPTKRTPVVAKTPKFEPNQHATPLAAENTEEDSFAYTCKKASPFKMPLSQDSHEDGSDSFVEQIITRSPTKPMTRIEDSVEAIDALEDAIEQVAVELPKLGAGQLMSPAKKSTLDQTPGKQSLKRKVTSTATPARSGSIKSLSSKASSTKLSPSKSPAKEAAKSPLRSGSGPQKPSSAPRPAVNTTKKAIVPRQSTSKAPPATAGARLASTAAAQISFSNSPAKPRANMAHKRAPGSILPSVQAPFVPKPSSKPPTTSTFSLPGEAVAAKLKAEREERLKRMEAGENIKSTKAAPAIKRAVSIEKKAPTVPSYQLPGDAIAAKLKAEREERLKRMEAGENKKPEKAASAIKRTVSVDKKAPAAPSYQLPGDAVAAKLKAQREARLEREAAIEEKTKTFKARPAPVRRSSVAPRETKTSSLRISSVHRNNGEDVSRRGSDKENVAPAPAQAPIPQQRLEVKKIRNSIGPGRIPSAAASRRSMNLSNQNVQERKAEPTVTLSRAEKEEAARKARAEAAERGRAASREWAERQKKKMMLEKEKAAKGGKEMGLEGVAEVAL